MGIFSGIKNAEYYESGKYVAPGLYLGEVLKVKQGMSRKKRGFFAVELRVLESSNSKDHPVGTDMTWMVMLDQDAAMGNIKHFIAVAGDMSVDEVEEEDANDAVSESNPLAGVKLRISAVNVKTLKGGDFTKVKFSSASTSLAQVQEAHAKASEELHY